MKGTKVRIIETSIILYIIGVIIEAHYSAISLGYKFFTYDVFERALAYAWFYFVAMFLETNENQILIYLRNLFIVQIILIYLSDTEGKELAENIVNWRNVLFIVYMIATFLLVKHQSKKLMKEDESKKFDNLQENS